MARTKDFAQIIRAKLAANPDLAEAVENESFISNVAMQVYEARSEAGLTQKQLADRLGTHQSVISRIEDADYDGHTLATLKRLAQALGKKLRVEFYASTPCPDSVTSESFTPQWETAEEWHPQFQESA